MSLVPPRGMRPLLAVATAVALAGSVDSRPLAGRGLAGLAPAASARAPGAGASHPDSQSRTILTWAAGRPLVEVKVQVTSLAEVLPELAVDEGGALSAEALAQGADAIRTYLGQHLAVVIDGAALDLGHGEVAFEAPDGARGADGWQWVVLRAEGARGPAASASIEMDLFLETSPGHLDTLVVRWPDALPEVEVLSAGSSTWEGRPGPSLRLTQAREGARAAGTGVAWLCLLSLICARMTRREDGMVEGAAVKGAPSKGGMGTSLLVLLWSAGAAGAFWVPTEALGLESRTLGLASAIAAVYFGSDGLLNGPRVRRPLEPLLAGVAMGLGLAAHPEVLPGPLDPGGAVALFCAGGVLGGALLALATVGLLRWLPGQSLTRGVEARAVQALVTLAGLSFFGARAFGAWAPGP
jgi:hypothetical protein